MSSTRKVRSRCRTDERAQSRRVNKIIHWRAMFVVERKTAKTRSKPVNSWVIEEMVRFRCDRLMQRRATSQFRHWRTRFEDRGGLGRLLFSQSRAGRNVAAALRSYSDGTRCVILKLEPCEGATLERPHRRWRTRRL